MRRAKQEGRLFHFKLEDKDGVGVSAMTFATLFARLRRTPYFFQLFIPLLVRTIPHFVPAPTLPLDTFGGIVSSERGTAHRCKHRQPSSEFPKKMIHSV